MTGLLLLYPTWNETNGAWWVCREIHVVIHGFFGWLFHQIGNCTICSFIIKYTMFCILVNTRKIIWLRKNKLRILRSLIYYSFIFRFYSIIDSIICFHSNAWFWINSWVCQRVFLTIAKTPIARYRHSRCDETFKSWHLIFNNKLKN